MKKFLALLLSVVMVCSAAVPALAADITDVAVTGAQTYKVTFPDSEGHWAEESISRWALNGIVKGDTQGKVNPNKLLTRGEFSEMLVRLLGLSKKSENHFVDLKGTEWYADSILKVAAAGIMLGDKRGNCNGNKFISRQETIVMFARAMGMKPESDPDLSEYSDGDTIASWAAGYIAPLTKQGLLNGTIPGKMVAEPNSNINRASILALLDKAVRIYIATPGEYEVNEPNGFVVVNVPGDEDVTVSGKACGVVIAAGTDAADVVIKDMTADTLRVDGAADVTLDGETEVESVAVNAEGNLVIGEKTAVEDLDVNAAAQIVNNGEVTNLNTNETGVTFDGNAPEAVNTAADAEPAKDSKGNEVTAKGEEKEKPDNSGATVTPSTPSVKSADVVAAPIADHAGSNAIADGKLGTVTVKGTQSGSKDGAPFYKVTVTGKNIMNHTNAAGDNGHWVGFGMPAKVNAEGESGTYTYEVGGSVIGSIATRTYEVKGKTYNTVYFSKDTEEAFKDAKYTIAVKDGDKLVATYEVSFNVTFYKASGVTVSKSLLDPADEGYFGKFAIATLFPTATQSGYDITLKGEIDPDKLNKNSGADDPLEFTYYGLEVTDENIKTLHNVSATPSDFAASAKWSMAARIYDTANTKPVKATHVFELLDAAGRVQDTVTVTVDATACSIKGMKKATFVDADGNVVDTLYGTSVTAPAAPENTDEVYYTGKWTSGGTVVAAGGSVDLTADATFTAKSVKLTDTTLSVRMDGPEGNHGPVVEDFEYSKVYAAAGLTMEGSKITVDATELTAMVKSTNATTAGNLARIMGNGSLADKVVFGVAYQTPAGAKKVAFAGKWEDLPAAENYRILAEHPSCYNDTLISYIPVATIIDPETKEITFAEDGVADSDFCKWVDEAGNVVAVTKTVIEIETVNIPEPPAPATYTVTFKDGETVVETVENVAEGATVAIPEGKEILTAEGKGFLGWYVGETKYNATAPITEDTVVTAKWTETIPTTPGVDVPDNAVVSALGITTEVENGVVTITIPANVKEKFDAMTDAQKGQLNHKNTLYMRVNSNVPTGADGNWFFQGSTDNGVTWRAKVAVTKDALGSKGINVTETDGAITAIGHWFGFATVENETGNNFALRTPAGDWTVIYRWTNAANEMEYTTFQVKFVHAEAETPENA